MKSIIIRCEPKPIIGTYEIYRLLEGYPDTIFEDKNIIDRMVQDAIRREAPKMFYSIFDVQVRVEE